MYMWLIMATHAYKNSTATVHFTKWGSYGTGDGQFSSPIGIAADNSGNVYVTDVLNNDRIQKFDGNGNFITKWGSNGTADGQFTFPRAVAVGSSGNVYLGDDDNRIQVFAPKV
jgi:tripartite motif-containing protein 71